MLCGRQTFALRRHYDSTKTIEAQPTSNHGNFQSKIIDVICTHIRKHIVERGKKCRFCDVIADEVTDAANREQLSLVIRYFNPESKTGAERLLDFTECHLGVTGHAIAETILNLLQKNHLDPELLRGQGYDSASNMAEKVKGAAAIITYKHPLALYFHCASQQLDLTVIKLEELISVKNLMGICKKLHDFLCTS